jgi:hypothetical protein
LKITKIWNFWVKIAGISELKWQEYGISWLKVAGIWNF